jgi:DNA-binding NarL/FixJ family response regulator
VNYIVLIEGISLSRFTLKKMLVQEGYNVSDYAQVGDWLESRTAQDRVDLMIVSVSNGDEALRFVQERKHELSSVPLIFLLREISKDTVSFLATQGAVDFLLKPVDNKRLLDRIHSLLPNRFITTNPEELIRSELARAERGKYSFSILQIGLKDPAQSEETPAVRVLDRLKTELAGQFRKVDSMFIYANKLVVLLPFTHKSGAKVVVGKVERFLKEHEALFPNKLAIGCATYPDDSKNWQGMLDIADSRMEAYELAKQIPAKAKEQKALEPAWNGFKIQAKIEGYSVKLSWENAIGSKLFEVRRYSGSYMEFSKKMHINRFLDNYTRAGAHYTYRIAGFSKQTGQKVESSIEVYVPY